MFCKYCGKEIGDIQRFCPYCGNVLVETTPIEVPIKQNSITKASKDETQYNWFHKHLNWTWVLSWLFAFMVAVIIIVLLIAINLSTNSAYAVGELFLFFIMLISSAWVIRQKRRSLWWLLLAGWWSPLWLSNNEHNL